MLNYDIQSVPTIVLLNREGGASVSRLRVQCYAFLEHEPATPQTAVDAINWAAPCAV
jgi:hypothetical protein